MKTCTLCNKFEVLQQWEGVIRQVGVDEVECEITDLTNPSSPVELVAIPITEFSCQDHSLIAPGGVFCWSIGYETIRGGQVTRISEITMRRFGVVTKLETMADQTASSVLFSHLDELPSH